MLTVVFDCMIYLQSIIRDSEPAVEILRLIEGNEFKLHISMEILEEVQNVLSRPRIRQKNPQITDQRIAVFIRKVMSNATVAESVPQHFNYVLDPKDEKYLNLAIEINADYLVTRDNDLLDLIISDDIESKDFRNQFPQVKIIDPVNFLIIIKSIATFTN